MVQPSPLKVGDRVALLAPAGACDKVRLEAGTAILESWGLTVEPPPDGPAFRYMAGSDEKRGSELAGAFADERIRAVLRRADLAAGGESSDDEPKILRGDLVLDPARHECSWRGAGVTLTVTEFLILKSLVSRPGHVRSRDQLMDAAYDDNIYVDDRTIDSHIKRIRKKLKAVDRTFSQIETLYGVGYRYTDR